MPDPRPLRHDPRPREPRHLPPRRPRRRTVLPVAFALALAATVAASPASANAPHELGGAYARVVPGPVPAYALLLVAPGDAPLAVHALAGAPATLGALTVPARLFPPEDVDARDAFAAWVDAAVDALAREPNPHGPDARERLRGVLAGAVGPDAVQVAPDRAPVLVPPGGAIGLLLTPLALDRRGGHADAVFEPVVEAAVGAGAVRTFPMFGPVRWPATP